MNLRGRTSSGVPVTVRLNDAGELVVEGLSALNQNAFASLGPWVEHDAIVVPVEPDAPAPIPAVECNEIKFVGHEDNSFMVYVGGAAVSSAKTPPLGPEEVEFITRVDTTEGFFVVAKAGQANQKLKYQTR